jgi:hypothetical protein
MKTPSAGWSEAPATPARPSVQPTQRGENSDGDGGPGVRQVGLANLQAWVSVLALIFSIPGFWFALSAFKYQQAANRSQVAANERDAQRYQGRYATRLAWMDAPWMPPGMSLEVQNRSTAVLRDVVLLNQSEGWAIFAGDIAPCSALILHVADIAGGHRDPDGFWEPELAMFRDPVGAWIRDEHALRPLADQEIGLRLSLMRCAFRCPCWHGCRATAVSRPCSAFPRRRSFGPPLVSAGRVERHYDS